MNNPIGNLTRALAGAEMYPAVGDGTPSRQTDMHEGIERDLRHSSLGLIEVVRRAEMSPGENLLIVVDRFEELYRFEPDVV